MASPSTHGRVHCTSVQQLSATGRVLDALLGVALDEADAAQALTRRRNADFIEVRLYLAHCSVALRLSQCRPLFPLIHSFDSCCTGEGARHAFFSNPSVVGAVGTPMTENRQILATGELARPEP